MLSREDLLEVFKYWEDNWLESTWLGEDLPNLIEKGFGIGLTNAKNGFVGFIRDGKVHTLKYRYEGSVYDWIYIRKNDFSVFEIEGMKIGFKNWITREDYEMTKEELIEFLKIEGLKID